MNLLLSAGHYPGDKGARFPQPNGEFNEHDEAKLWVASIVRHINYRTGVLLVPHLDLVGKVRWINTQPQADLAIEIHFNSDGAGRGRGSETLYAPGSVKGRVMADRIQAVIGAILLPNRGVKEGWHRMDRPGHIDYPGDKDGDEKVDYFLRATKCTALIVEPEFIHNKEKIIEHRERVCSAIAEVLV